MDLNELLKNKEQIKSLITLLQTVVDAQEGSSDEEDQVKQNSNTSENKIKTRRSRKAVQTKDDVNKFESMSEFNMHKADSAVDKKLSSQPPVARTREFEMMDVVCRVCGKRESVNPVLVHEGASRYKCNNCSRNSG